MPQTSLLDSLDKSLTGKPNGRKRTLTLSNGVALDLAHKIPNSNDEVVEAMRLRIIQLEDELAAQPPPAKRARTSTIPSVQEEAVAGPSAASVKALAARTKADEKKLKLRLKKIFTQLQKECKSPTFKFQGRIKTAKIDEVLEKEDFEALFMDKGTLVQPTPDNKPGSSVTIITYNGGSDMEALFGSELKPLKGDRWNIGGAPYFTKSRKLGPCEVNILSLEVSYSKNTMKATLKFDVAEAGYSRQEEFDDFW